MALDIYSDDELRNELERRQLKQKEEEKPKMFDNPNLDGLKAALNDYIEEIAQFGISDDTYIFEAAFEAFFGNDVFNWINENS